MARLSNRAPLRLSPSDAARAAAWTAARRDADRGGPDALRCDVDGCPWPSGRCPSHRAPVAQKAVA